MLEPAHFTLTPTLGGIFISHFYFSGIIQLCSNLFYRKCELISHAPRAWWLRTKSYALAPPPASAIATAATSQKFSLTIFLLRPPEKNLKRKGKFLLGSAQEVSGRCGGALTLGRLGIPPLDSVLEKSVLTRFGGNFFSV